VQKKLSGMEVFRGLLKTSPKVKEDA